MRRAVSIASLGFVALATLGLAGGRLQVDPRILAYDGGPDTIDVSKYPKDMRTRYKVFERKCKNCHSLARAINCELALEGEWESYVKRMMPKAGSFITEKNGRDILEFLVYDSKVRKTELYEKKSKELGNTLPQDR